jgi:hypothetical protein
MTNATASEGWKRYRLLPVIMALTCMFLWAAMFARIGDRAIQFNTDYTFLYLCGLELVHPELHERQIDLVKKVVVAAGDDQSVYRATMRANYCNNYPFTSLSMYLAGKWQTYFGVSAAEDFPAHFARSLWFGVFFSGALLGIVCILTIFVLAQGPLRTALFAAISLAAIYYLTVPPPRTNWFLYQASPGPTVNWLNVLLLGFHSWFHPGAPFSPFSVFPRCLCAVLAFTAFAIRWSGRPGAAYWMPLLVGAVHQSTAPILLFALICCDVVIRPWILARARILLPIAVNLVIILLRERMFAILGFSLWDFMVVVVISLCLVMALAMVRPVRVAVHAQWSYIAAWRRRTVEAVPLPFADALVIFAAWVGLLLVSYLASRSDAWYRVVYFWSELSPRYIGMFQLSFTAGILYPLVVMLSSRPAIERIAMVSAVVVSLGVATSQVLPEWLGLGREVSRASAFDQAVSAKKDVYAGNAVVPQMRDEINWYYLLVRSAVMKDRSLEAFFGRP